MVQDIKQHELIPEHTKLSDKEKQELFEKHNITFHQLPRIMVTDSMVKLIEAKVQDVIKITRKSPVAGVTVYYRGVVDE